jgi:preprotein translocase subunit SecG
MHWIGYITTFLTVINILVCLLLIFVVLLQRPKNEGLGAAFGGDTASNIFGAQTTNVLTNLTRWLGGLFLGLCLIIAFLGTKDPHRASAILDYVKQKEAEKKAEVEKEKAQKAAEAAAAGLKNPDPTAVKPSATSNPVITPGANPGGTPPPAPVPALEANPATPPAPAPSTPSATPGAPNPATPTPVPASTPTVPATPAPAPADSKPAQPAPAAPSTPAPASTPATPDAPKQQ